MEKLHFVKKVIQKILHIDLETTGTDHKKHGITQIAGMIEINGEIKETFNFLVSPFPDDKIDMKALKTQGRTRQQIFSNPPPHLIYPTLLALFDKYIDKFNKDDKFYPAGFKVDFDLDFLNEWFIKNSNDFFGSYQNWHCLDPRTHLNLMEFKGKIKLENYKLETVCNHFGIEIKAHDALSDIKATRELIYSTIFKQSLSPPVMELTAEKQLVSFGEYTICEGTSENNIFIRDQSGETGEFSVVAFEKIIAEATDKFYKDNY